MDWADPHHFYSSSASSSQPPFSSVYLTETEWTQYENKIFETCLSKFDINSPDLFEKIASRLPGRTIEQIMKHYKALLEDMKSIKSGRVPIPDYMTIEEPFENTVTQEDYVITEESQEDSDCQISQPSEKTVTQQSTKGLPWSQEEHRMFLEGLKQYGKGDWKNISLKYVPSRTPIQVSSHAQKYFAKIGKPSNKRTPPNEDGTRPFLSANTNFRPIAPKLPEGMTCFPLLNMLSSTVPPPTPNMLSSTIPPPNLSDPHSQSLLHTCLAHSTMPNEEDLVSLPPFPPSMSYMSNMRTTHQMV